MPCSASVDTFSAPNDIENTTNINYIKSSHPTGVIESVQYLSVCPAYGVMRGSPASYYSTISAAYNNASGGDSIYAQDLDFVEDLYFASDISVRLLGGYDCPFMSNTGLTAVKGKLTIKGGSIIIDKISIGPVPANQWVSGYYVGYQRDMYKPEEIDWSGLTHIIMGAVLARSDGTLDTTFFIDSVNGPALAADIANRAHAAHKRAILMLGGAGNGTQIRLAVTNHRALFITNLINAMNNLGYDGIDLDWEDDVDLDLFVTFAQQLRQAAPNAILTMPGGTINANYETVDSRLVNVIKELDQFNMMSYYPATAYAGSGWESWHNSPLKGAKPTTPVSIEDSFNRYVVAGVPKAKLGMGIGFYAICYTGGVTGPNQSTVGATIEGGDNDYPLAEIYGTGGVYSETTKHWDAEAYNTYLSLPIYAPERHGCLYVSFEDERSIDEKGTFSRDNGYGGIIIWTINQGYVKTHSDPYFLMQALRKGFIYPDAAQTVGISIMQGNVTISPSSTYQFRTLVTGTTDKTVTWSVKETSCGSVDGSGLYTAPGSAATCTVIAASQADTSKTASAVATVQ
jgi:chitinase